MDDAYTLTPTQQEAFAAHIGAIRGGMSFTDLALAMLDLPATQRHSKEVKNLSGYLGQAFGGVRRGLRYVYGNPERLEALSQALPSAQTPASLEEMLAAARQEHPDHDRIVASGLEDLGPVPLSAVYVHPPLRFGRAPLDEQAFRARCFGKKSKCVRILEDAGRGITTVLQRVAQWAVEDGYQPFFWDTKSPLPNYRGAVLLAERLTLSQVPPVESWVDQGDRHAVISLARDLPLAVASAEVRVHPVDAAWLSAWVDRVARFPKARRRWWPRHPARVVQAVLQYGALGPEEATTLFRWLSEHPSKDGTGPRAVRAALLRRASTEVRDRVPSATALDALADRDLDHALTVDRREALQSDLEKYELSPIARAVLEREVRSFSVAEAPEDLVDLGLLAPAGNSHRVRFAALLMPNAEDNVAGVLLGDDAPRAVHAWLAARQHPETLSWTPALHARCLAIELLYGLSHLPTTGMRPVVSPGPTLGLLARGTTATVDGVRGALRDLGDALGGKPDRWTDAELALAIAVSSDGPEILEHPLMWREAANRNLFDTRWIDSLRAAGTLPQVLLNATHPGGEFFLCRQGLRHLAGPALEQLHAEETDRFLVALERILEAVGTRGPDWIASGLLLTLNSALESSRVRRTARPRMQERWSIVADLLDRVDPMEAPRIDQVVRCALDMAEECSVGRLTNRLLVLARVGGIGHARLETLVRRLASGDLADPEGRGQALLDHAMVTLSLASLRRAWPDVDSVLENRIRSLGWPKSSCPAGWELTTSAPLPLHANHLLWKMVPEKRGVLRVGPLKLPRRYVPPRNGVLRLNVEEMQMQMRGPALSTASLVQVAPILQWCIAEADPDTRGLLALASAMDAAPPILEAFPTAAANVDGEALVDLLALLEAVRRVDQGCFSKWMLRFLAERPSVADTTRWSKAWTRFDGDRGPLNEWLTAGDAAERGAGLFGAYSEPADVVPYLERPATCAAAWERLLALAPDRAPDPGDHVPSSTVLARVKEAGNLDALLDASMEWLPERRAELLRRAAPMYRGPRRAAVHAALAEALAAQANE
jgi:hypothetical protein